MAIPKGISPLRIYGNIGAEQSYRGCFESAPEKIDRGMLAAIYNFSSSLYGYFRNGDISWYTELGLHMRDDPIPGKPLFERIE